MIVSLNAEALRGDFDILLNSTIVELNSIAECSSKKIEKLTGRKLEPFVRDVMTEMAIGTKFESSIELIGGQKFPDIIAKRYFGVEVKTTSQNHWKTTGNSVLESTRVEDVERIFLLFAKLASPIEFRCRAYEDVLSEVVVTHSPRYLIDMNLEVGQTIFDKINVPYDSLRKEENPIKPIVDYYRKKLKPGEDLWWMDSDANTRVSNIVIRIWNNLSKSEKKSFIISAMTFFPEMFGNRPDKFGRLAVWLATQEAIICPNVRDSFTAGGVATLQMEKLIIKNVPRILINLFQNIEEIKKRIELTSAYDLGLYWNSKTTEKTKLIDWIDLVSENAKMIRGANHINVNTILRGLLLK